MKIKKKLAGWLPTTVAIIIFLLIWQFGAIAIGMEHVIPTPVSTVKKIIELREYLFGVNLRDTVVTIFLGLFITVIVGVIFAVLMDLSDVLADMLYPVLVAIQSVPTMCIAPLFVLWFGYTLPCRLLVVVLSTFFGVTVNTYDGLKSTKREMEELMKTYGAGRLQIFMKLRVRCALPSFFSSLKMVFPWAVVGAAVAEWIGASSGLGYFSKRMITQLDGAAVFAPVVIITAISLAGMALIKFADKKIVTWRGEI